MTSLRASLLTLLFTLASAGDDRNRLLFTTPRGPDSRTDLVVRARPTK